MNFHYFLALFQVFEREEISYREEEEEEEERRNTKKKKKKKEEVQRRRRRKEEERRKNFNMNFNYFLALFQVFEREKR